MTRLKQNLIAYLNLLPFVFGLVFILRLSELLLVAKSHCIEGLLGEELIGFLSDIPIAFFFFLFLFPVFHLVSLVHNSLEIRLFKIVLVLIALNHMLILPYFAYFLTPLSRFLKANTFQEIVFTLSTSDVPIAQAILWFVLLIVTISGLCFALEFHSKSNDVSRVVYIGSIVALLLVPFTFTAHKKMADPISSNLRINKSVYFYKALMFGSEHQIDTNQTDFQVSQFHQVHASIPYVSDEYPFLAKTDIPNVLSSYFNVGETSPNIVFLIVEGLGTRFVDPLKGLNLMPFLDSLIRESLYWPNCLTSTERSFGAVPSLLGSLPYAERGFTFQDTLPEHLNLIHILNENDYCTGYFYGQGAWFHRKDHFLRFSGIDFIFDNSSFSGGYNKIVVGKDRFFWGYNDLDLFRQSFEVLDTLPKQPLFSTYFTGSTHAPFLIPDEDRYDRKLDSLAEIRLSPNDRRRVDVYRKYLRTVVFTDDALRSFFEDWQKRLDFENTIFILTGDHPMTEIPIRSWLERYRVPLIIYSAKLKKAHQFPAVVSHFDVYPTLLAWLSKSYDFKVPQYVQTLGAALDTFSLFRVQNPVVLMNTDREAIDYMKGTRFLANGELLFDVDSNLNLSMVKNGLLTTQYQKEMKQFNSLNRFVCNKNRLLPDSVRLGFSGYSFLKTFFIETNSIKPETEYLNLIQEFDIQGKAHLVVTIQGGDVQISNSATVPLVVCQIENEKGETIFWQAEEISLFNNKKFEFNVLVNNGIDWENCKLAMYVWNSKKGEAKWTSMSVNLFCK